MSKRSLLSIAILALLLASAIAGCAQAAQKAVEQTTGVQVNQKGDTVTVKGKDGEQVTFGSQMPDQLKNFPAPPGFTVQSGGNMSSKGDNVAVANWKGKGTIDDVSKFFAKAMPDQGWKQGMNFVDSNSGGVLSYSKDNDSVTITLSKSDDQIEIAVLYGKNTQK